MIRINFVLLFLPLSPAQSFSKLSYKINSMAKIMKILGVYYRVKFEYKGRYFGCRVGSTSSSHPNIEISWELGFQRGRGVELLLEMNCDSFSRLQSINMEVGGQNVLMQIIGCLASPDQLQTVNQLGESILNNSGREIFAFDPKFLNQLLQRAEERASEAKNVEQPFVHTGAEDYWHPNELKSFTWVSVCLAFLTGRCLADFEPDQYHVLTLIFPTKSYFFLRYNHVALVRPVSKARKLEWSAGEVQLLTEIIKGAGEIKWSRVSLELYEKSKEEFFRTAVQCREKWINHLKPSVKRGGWELEEDEELISLVIKCGTKWSLISRQLQGARTEHMIKNRYNSLVKKYRPKKYYKPMEYLLNNIAKQLRRKILTRKNKNPVKNNQVIIQGIDEEQKSSPVIEVESEEQSHRSEVKDVHLRQEEIFIPVSALGVELDACMLMGSRAEGKGNSCEEVEKCQENILENWQEDEYYRQDNWLDNDDDRMDLSFLKGRMLLCDMEPLHPTNFE